MQWTRSGPLEMVPSMAPSNSARLPRAQRLEARRSLPIRRVSFGVPGISVNFAGKYGHVSRETWPRRSDLDQQAAESAPQQPSAKRARDDRGAPEPLLLRIEHVLRSAVTKEVDPRCLLPGEARAAGQDLAQTAERADQDCLAPVRGRHRLELLQARAHHPHVREPEAARGLFEEADLPLARLEQRDPRPGPHDRERDPRHPAAAPDVPRGLWRLWKGRDRVQ